jgi:hypothetical protein
MKCVLAILTAAIMATTSPAFAGGRVGGLLGGVVAPVTAVVSAVNVNALNNVSVLNGAKVSVLSGNSTKAGVKTHILDSGFGCGCY